MHAFRNRRLDARLNICTDLPPRTTRYVTLTICRRHSVRWGSGLTCLRRTIVLKSLEDRGENKKTNRIVFLRPNIIILVHAASPVDFAFEKCATCCEAGEGTFDAKYYEMLHST